MEKKQIEKKQKSKKNIGKIGTKIMAIILATMMIVSIFATIIYYFVFTE